MRMSKWAKIVAVAVCVAGLGASAFAQGRGNGGGGGGGGGGGEETASNNLSVPAILLGGYPTLNFPVGVVVSPSGTPLSGYPLSPTDYFYVQGVHKWQASTVLNPEGVVNLGAEWGDNLTGDAKLSTGSPIRVEMGLLADGATDYGMTGWDVYKLEPDKLDREAAYGTPAFSNGDGTFASDGVSPYPEVRVFDSLAWLKIYNKDTGVIVTNAPASAEINSTGRIVYGYNLRVPTAGTYVIEFSTGGDYINVTSVDGVPISADTPNYAVDPLTGSTTIALEINVTSGGGKGGGKGGGGGGKGGHVSSSDHSERGHERD